MGNIYIYLEQNLRAYPGTVRGTKEWDSAYFSTNWNLSVWFLKGFNNCYILLSKSHQSHINTKFMIVFTPLSFISVYKIYLEIKSANKGKVKGNKKQ